MIAHSVRFVVSLLVFACPYGVAAEGDRGSWLQWGGGSGREFRSPAPRLATKWPEDGPKVLWERELGEDGQSAILFHADRLFTMTRRGDQEVIVSLDAATGASVWETAYAAPAISLQDPAFGLGPHSTPAIAGGRIYAIGGTVKLHACDLETGKILWKHDLMTEMGSEPSSRSYGSSPLVTRDLVIVVAGAENQGVVAFHQASGEVVWKSRTFKMGFSSPLLASVDGQDQVIVGLGSHRAGLDPATGELLWLLELDAEAEALISTQLWWEDQQILFGSSAYGDGSRAIRLRRGDGGETRAEVLWMTRKMRVHHGNVVRLGDHVYGSSGDFGPAFLAALHLPTGEIAFRQRGLTKANLLSAGDGRLLILDEDGQLALAEASPEGMEILAQAKVLERTAWTVPTLVGERLYLRNRKIVKALDLGSP